MKKILLLTMASVLAVSLFACGENNGNSKKNSIIHNAVNGKQLYFTPASNYENIESDEKGLILVSGETYDFQSYVMTVEHDMDYSYDCSNTVWTIGGNIGYFDTPGVKSAAGKNVSITINASAGQNGTLKLELDGMMMSFPVKIVSEIQD